MRSVLFTASGVLIFLLLAGATYQGVATAIERRQFPHPGKLIDIGGHQLHISCVGEGSPTVVLEAPATGMSAAWGWVQPRVARRTRVCSYDRAGLGWSEAGDNPYDPGAVPDELHTLLERAGEMPPFLLVGQGLGAAFVTIYAARFKPTIAGLVLIDAPSRASGAAPRETATGLANAAPWLARAGLLRTLRLMSNSAAGLPPASAGALGAFLNRPDHLTRSARELSRWNDAVRLADASPIPGIRVVRAAVLAQDQVAFLTAEPDAAKASAAINAALEQARAKR
jgi:pimeloyl-ACP methyl ester carboxylesterase